VLALLLVGIALTLAACSATHQEVRPDGDVVVRSGPTTLGWIWMGAVTCFVAVFLAVSLVTVVGIIGEEVVERVRDKQAFRAAGWALLLPMFVGFVGVIGWAVAWGTVLQYQRTVVTASRADRQLTVERSRPIGSDEKRRYPYDAIENIEFDYIPGSGGENGSPPHSVVYVGAVGHRRAQIFDGDVCTARKLAGAITQATGVRTRVVGSDLPDISSYDSLFTQLRCGTKRSVPPTTLIAYPGELWHALDMPFLWEWPWAIPVLLAQCALAAVVAVATRHSMIGGFIALMLAAFGIFALNLLAASESGRYPGSLGLLALIAIGLGSRGLRRKFMARPSADETRPVVSVDPRRPRGPEPGQSPSASSEQGKPDSESGPSLPGCPSR
jgi:hypothetical protein